MTHVNKLKVENSVQAALFSCELLGQFSDGFWENHSHRGQMDHWKVWGNTEIVVAEAGEEAGRNFSAYNLKDNYNLSAKDLLDCVGDRMCLYARLARAGFAPSDINMLEYAFGSTDHDENGKFVWDVKPGGPEYSGGYYDTVRMFIKSIPVATLEAVAKDTAFDMKELKHELFRLKKVMKNRVYDEVAVAA